MLRAHTTQNRFSCNACAALRAVCGWIIQRGRFLAAFICCCGKMQTQRANMTHPLACTDEPTPPHRSLPVSAGGFFFCGLQSADADSRSVMERRVQSLVDVLSGVYHFLQEQKTAVPRSSLESSGPPAPSSSTSRGAANGSARKGRGKTTAETGGGAAAMDVEGESEEGGSGDSGSRESSGSAGLVLAESPPLNLVADSDVVEVLWSGKQSMMRRLIRKLDTVYNEKLVVESPDDNDEEEVVSQSDCFFFCIRL